jgi:anti-sigma B factor antagonist
VVVVQQDGRPLDRPAGDARSGGPDSGRGTVEMVTDGSDPVRVLRAEGELDLALVPPLLARVPELVEGAAGLVLDLRPVTFLDSSGLRLLERFARECGERGTPFAAVAPERGGPRRILEIVGFGPPMVVEQLSTAIAAVSPRTP